jgi:hypothetical protein
LPHDLPEESLAALLTLFSSVGGVQSAWLARKDLAYFPHRPLFVLCVRSTGSSAWDGADRDRELASLLAAKVQLPGQSLVVGHRGPFRALGGKVARQPDAEVFPGPRPGAAWKA